MSIPDRTPEFARVAPQEDLLHEVNRYLAAAESTQVSSAHTTPRLPLVFIVGAPRSGTTLMLQWLAASNVFAYPSNLLARFYAAPHIGAKIQQLITDPRFDYHDELSASEHAITWSSNVGKTQGMLQPHEFFYFWRRFFAVDQAQKLTPEQLRSADPVGFAAGWAAIEAAFGKPVAAKGILLQYDIERLAAWLPTSVFIHTVRDPAANVESLLRARERVYGSRATWFSVRPPEHDWLQHEDPGTQVAGQVLYTNARISESLRSIPAARGMRVEYQDFCAKPATIWAGLAQALALQGLDIGPYNGLAGFNCSDGVRRDGSKAELIAAALQAVTNRMR